ncbi:FKBP-type peptidyl-prolyl cis-trans isomerase [Sorangium sp. So ce1099]|uniref:FKBP-type peptidyl-prolyl cis-trans isomerase n=1 Tax=Sorangium sp. So ce1099 TaxID=3133331 RepID=UPI003F5FAF4B
MKRCAILLAVLTLPLGACDQKPSPQPVADSPAPASAAPSAPAAPTAELTAREQPAEPAGLPAPPDVAAPPADAQKTASGLAFKVLTPGKDQAHPGPDDKVTVHYTGWTTDGKMFDSSTLRGEPASFGVSGVIKGWTEALQLMSKGEKRRLWIPGSLAYGDRPTRPGAPAGMLVFDVELLDFAAAPKPPPAPKDVKAAPKAAKKTASGLAYQVLQKGTGTEHPKPTSRVTVHYTGWTTDGKMFDSSIVRDEPATFPVGGVIKGWTEGVQLMVKGEKTRFWIPAELAYGEKPTRPGAPAGMLVFDIELIDFR